MINYQEYIRMSFLSRFVPSRDLLSIPNIRWLVASRFFADLFFYSTTTVLFQQQRGLNFTAMFLMESIISAAVWLFDLPTGIWADRFGYRRLIIAGRALNVLGLLFFTFSYGFWPFALSNMLSGLSIACISGCESALVYSSLPTQEKEQAASSAFALLNAASSAGFFLGLLTGSFIGAYSPTLAVAVSIAPASLSLLSALRLRPPLKLQSIEPQEKSISSPKLFRVALRTIREQPVLVGLSFFDSAAFALANAIFWYNQAYFTRAGVAVIWFGPLMAAAMGLQMLALLRLSSLQKFLSTRVLLLLSCLLPGCAYILLAIAHTPIPVALLVSLVVVFASWRQPLIQTELNLHISDESRATTLSALSFLGALAGIALNPLIGYVGDLGLPVTGLTLGLSMVTLCAMVPFLMARRKKR